MIPQSATPLSPLLLQDLNPWEQRLVTRNQHGARVAIWLVMILYPTFGILDYFVAPNSDILFWLLMGRGGVVLTSLVMLGMLKSKLFIRQADSLTASYMYIVGAGICLMVSLLGGLTSPYYAGLNLVMIGCGLLYVWPPKVCITVHSLICLSWLIPNLIFNETSTPIIALSNGFFLFSTGCIVSAGQIFNFQRLRAQHDTQCALEETKGDLEVAHLQLKQLDSFKNRFFANITHELKTPLALILSSLELMLKGELGYTLDEQQKPISQMQRSGAKLLKLINDLLDLTKLEESRLRLKIKEEEMVHWTRSIVEDIRPLAERKGVSIHFLSEKDQLNLWCDLERLERVVINLLSNATKFTEKGGSIQVRMMDLNHSVRLEVQDTGRGFSPEDAQKIFQRFYQTDMGATRQYGGTGIGLALAQELVDLHKGKIWATGEEGIGATFYIELRKGSDHFDLDLIQDELLNEESPDITSTIALPFGREFKFLDVQEASERRIVERDDDEDSRHATVLIAEDNPDITRLLHLALRRKFKVITAGNGQKAWELMDRFHPDLVITDLMMPIMDGLEFTNKIKDSEVFKKTPVIMLSARDGIQEEMRLKGHSANAYMSKPFSTRKLSKLASALIQDQQNQLQSA
jgi:signal transduction histidine kinase/CheY-like chemotaxis protein